MTEIEVELEESTVDMLVEQGLARKVLVLTGKGNAWILEFCKSELDKCCGDPDPGDCGCA